MAYSYHQRKAAEELAKMLSETDDDIKASLDDVEDDEEEDIEDGCPVYDDDVEDNDEIASERDNTIRHLIEDPGLFDKPKQQYSSRIQHYTSSDAINSWINLNYRPKWFQDINIKPDDNILQIYGTYQTLCSGRYIGIAYRTDYPIPDEKHPGHYELRCTISHNTGTAVHDFSTQAYPKPATRKMALKTNINAKRVAIENDNLFGIHGLMPMVTLYVDQEGHLYFSRTHILLTRAEFSSQLRCGLTSLYKVDYTLNTKLRKHYHHKQIQHAQYLKLVHKGETIELFEHFQPADMKNKQSKSNLIRTYLVLRKGRDPYEVTVGSNEKLTMAHLK